MAFDSPKLGGYTFQNPPDANNFFPEVIQQVNELADGSTKQRILGYRYRGTLEWKDNWIKIQDLTGIMAVANDASASITFVPRPQTYPTRTYVVIWTNKFQFTNWNGLLGVWNGTIDLVTPSTTSTITDLP